MRAAQISRVAVRQAMEKRIGVASFVQLPHFCGRLGRVWVGIIEVVVRGQIAFDPHAGEVRVAVRGPRSRLDR